MHRQCPEISHPIDSLFHIAPLMAITLLPIAFALEYHKLVEAPQLQTFDGAFASLTLVWVGSFMAFGLVMSEFFLVKTTSSVTLSVAGMFKEVFTITVAVLLKGEPLSPLNMVGLAVSLVGIGYYNVLKYRGFVAAPRHYTPLSSGPSSHNNSPTGSRGATLEAIGIIDDDGTALAHVKTAEHSV